MIINLTSVEFTLDGRIVLFLMSFGCDRVHLRELSVERGQGG